MILDSLEISYEIFEANNRIGGRIYTHRFNGEAGKNAPVGDPARYDYFDIGAMRYPRIPFMKRVFELFEKLQIDKLFVDYTLSGEKNFMYFNDARHTVATADQNIDPFSVSEPKGTVPLSYLERPQDAGDNWNPVDYWTNAIYGPYKELFAKIEDAAPTDRQRIFEEAWDTLTEQDHHSTRGYMLAGPEGKPPKSPAAFPEPVVQWLETFDSATGLYNQGFVESVLDSLDFGWPTANVAAKPFPGPYVKVSGFEDKDLAPWVCIDGGSDRFIDAMVKSIKTKPEIQRRVTRISETNDQSPMVVEWKEGDILRKKSYSQVICTAPLGCVASIDLKDANLLYNQKVAIRSLQYDASTKVAVKFAKRWWEDPELMGEDGWFKAGTSKTDLPIRSCVYPSYGHNCPPENPPSGVLMTSYTWAQDAQRLGALAQPKGTSADNTMMEIMLDNISRLHNIPRDKIPQPVDHYAHAWYNDEFARGAFALFGPGQFGHVQHGNEPKSVQASLFASMKAPAAKGKLHFAGEATSVHHAWVLGALNSAWRAVYNALEGHQELQNKLIELWKIPDEETQVHLKQLNLLARYDIL
ncbi:hypothetical protein BDV93DRAFT_459584 [Ceratobasidium sp. AG-I]|nr:hypothetical protein BDV93DRAFT_459584 [Ceratobasidium sp. AG-I]